MERVRNRSIHEYSEALKLEVVKEIESGRVGICEASRHYQVPRSTVSGWVGKYGRMKKKSDKKDTEIMRKENARIQELESELADARLKMKLYEKMIEIAGEEYGLEFKKNSSTGQFELVKRTKNKA